MTSTRKTATARDVVAQLRALGDPEDARFLQRFFKTGAGEYGAGDRFLGIRVPVVRGLVRSCGTLPESALRQLLASQWHEVRLFALLSMVRTADRGTLTERAAMARLYLDNLDAVNNWDLVDASAPYILGPFLDGEDRSLLDELAASPDVWRRRVAMLTTFHFIRAGEFDDALRIAARLVDDGHDLIHKAVGWMLREIGKRNVAAEEQFLQRHYRRMPRTMLRYAIERFPAQRRRQYLVGTA